VASNSPEFLKALAMHGAGIIRVAEFLVRDDIASGRLVPVLEGRMEEEIVPFFALYPRPLNQVSRTSVFVDFLSQKLSHRLPKTGRINIPQLRAG
jgi:DNA-binding transcriptional LysR family regulator